MTRSLFAFLLAFPACPSPAGAVAFNDVAPGARAMGMGYAFSAIADDVYGMFYNPAGGANTPYIQAGGTLGRLQSPRGSLYFASGAYLRPYEPINTATIGAAYFLERQKDGGDIDALVVNYGQELRVRDIPLSKPLKVGMNAKIINSDSGSGGKFGLGVDAGVIVRSNMGLSGGIVISDLVTSLAYPRPAITLASAYTWQRRLTLAGDFRVRGGLAEFYPGLEASFHQNLLRVRAGKGLSLDGIATMNFGLGLNFSPMILDVAMALPTGGINRQGGGYQGTFSYRFGAPSFTGQFVGQAAAQAQELRSDLSELEEKKKTLSQQTAISESNKAVIENELRALSHRIREAQDAYRALLKRNDELEYRAAEKTATMAPAPKAPPPPKVRPPAPPPPPSWPKRHVVKTGDTLRGAAKEYYGDHNLWEKIYDANRDKVDRGLPMEGAVLVIPAPN